MRDLQTRILERSTRRAGSRQVAASNFEPARNSSDSVAHLVDLRGSDFSEYGQALHLRNLAVVQLVELVAAVAQLLNHVVEVTTENSQLAAAIAEVCACIEIAIRDARNPVLKVRH